MTLLVLVAGVAALGLVFARRHDRAVRTSGEAGGPFVCPMHAEVSSATARECPICGMALVRIGTVVRDVAAAGLGGAIPDGGETIAAAQLLSGAAGGLSPNLVGYYPSPLRQHVLRYEIYAAAWLESESLLAVQVYRDQLPTLEADEHAVFSPTADPSTERDVRLAPGPAQPWDRSTSLVRFALQAGAGRLSPGTVGWVKFARRPRRMEVIPAAAVLESPEGPYVLVFSRASGAATRRAIEVGRITTGLAAVLSGLSPRELVVSVNAFSWDAERRLQGDRGRSRDERGVGGKPR